MREWLVEYSLVLNAVAWPALSAWHWAQDSPGYILAMTTFVAVVSVLALVADNSLRVEPEEDR